MSRPRGYDGRTVRARAALEDTTAAIVRAELLLRMVRLRVTQALERSGLWALLGPAVDDLDDARSTLARAKGYLSDTTQRLLAFESSSREIADFSPGAGAAGDGRGLPQNGPGGPRKDDR